MGLAKFFKVSLIRFYAFLFASNRSKVIFYHDIHSKTIYTSMSTSIRLFKRHIDIINEMGYEIVSEITKPTGQIEICFDDAFLGLYENIEFLKQNNIPIHVFLITSYLGKNGYINQRQLLELKKLDFVKISSHTKTHRTLNKLKAIEIDAELRGSKKIIEDLLAVPVEDLCYPKGVFNDAVIKIAKSAGYKRQYCSLPGFICLDDQVVRRSLVQFASEKEFRAILKGGDHILYFWYRFKHFRV